MPSGAAKTAPIRVLIADDHPVVLNGLAYALTSEPDLTVVGLATDGLEVEELATKLQPDVIVTDILMPNRDGIQAMLKIRERLPKVKVLFLTVSDREEHLFEAIRLGADGYLLKKSHITEIVNAVRCVAAGEAVLSGQVTSKVMSELRGGRKDANISQREQQVLELLAKGLTSSEMAEKLCLSQSTVSSYVYRLLQKLHLKNRLEAVAYLLRHPASTKPS
ncbi:MAG: response regulator transcription factor [Chloroflexi bacterium]|nr:response regulator transcription factor [Chloroflexota bacterium]